MTFKKNSIILEPADFLKWDPTDKSTELLELNFNKSTEKPVSWDPTDLQGKIV